MMKLIRLLAFVSILGSCVASYGGVVFGNSGLSGGHRWDAAARTLGGLERSLDGGLRYSLEGGSFESYRDMFSWNVVPTVMDFQTAVENAFAAWTATDPVSGLGTTISFTQDLGTPVDATVTAFVRQGAEIDLFATNFGDSGTRGQAFFNTLGSTVTLTSGTTGYAASAISGADVEINSNIGATYTLDLFRRLLTHELGHAIGLGDVENSINPDVFIDDDYDGTSPATALATLTNSWAGLVNVTNPSASVGISLHTISDGDPGLNTTGVNILMESNGIGIAAGNPVTNLIPLRNDDYGTRQFLYPTAIPEPSAVLAIPFVCAVFGFPKLVSILRSRKKRNRDRR